MCEIGAFFVSLRREREHIHDTMPRYIPSQPFADCWSSVGDVTFYHRDGVCFWRKRALPEYPGTPAQLQYLDLHRRALAAWRELPSDVQHSWNGFAAVVPSHKPPFLPDHHISGYNLFVSAYHGHALLGRECVPVPMPWQEFPVFHLEYVSAERAEPDGIRMVARVKLEKAIDPTRYRVLLKVQLTEPGKGRQPGYLRNSLAPSNCHSSCSEVEFFIENYAKIWPVVGPLYQVHCRYLLIDTMTGYRCNYKKTSFLMEL